MAIITHSRTTELNTINNSICCFFIKCIKRQRPLVTKQIVMHDVKASLKALVLQQKCLSDGQTASEFPFQHWIAQAMHPTVSITFQNQLHPLPAGTGVVWTSLSYSVFSYISATYCTIKWNTLRVFQNRKFVPIFKCKSHHPLRSVSQQPNPPCMTWFFLSKCC